MKKLFVILLALTAVFALGANPLSAAGTVNGVVIDADDAGVAGAMVGICGLDHVRGQRPFMKQLESGENGLFTIEEVPAGKYMVKACVREVGFATAQIEVVDGEAVDVALKLAGRADNGGGEEPEVKFGSLIGTVVDADGNAVEGAKVMIMKTDANRRHMRNFRNLAVKTDAEGKFTFEKLPVGIYVIGAAMPEVGAVRGRVEIVENEQAEIALKLAQCKRGEGGGGHGGGGRP